MKAQTLEQALNLFDPEHPLKTEQELKEYFINRENSPLQELEIFLKKTETRPKLLFTGHRGSGKSTELAKLALLLKSDFFIVNYSVKKVINLFDVKYVDVILSLATELFKAATESKIKINKELVSDIFVWFNKEIIKEVSIETKGQADISAAFNLFFTKLESKIGTESSTRTLVREKIEPRLSELLEKVNLIIGEIERITKKRVLIIIEDLDKADLSSAREIFCGHCMSLTQPHCRIIYTFPIALRHDNDFINICHNFDEPYVLPNFKTAHQDGRPDEQGITELSQLILHRAEEKLFTEKAIQFLVSYCGGLPRELVTLTRRSCLIALQKNFAKIDENIVEQAGNRLRNDYQVLLTSSQLDILKKVHQTKRLENDELHRALLHNLSLLEYRNKDVWHDVHPIVIPLLNK